MDLEIKSCQLCPLSIRHTDYDNWGNSREDYWYCGHPCSTRAERLRINDIVEEPIGVCNPETFEFTPRIDDDGKVITQLVKAKFALRTKRHRDCPLNKKSLTLRKAQ